MFIPDLGFWLWIFYHSGSRIRGSKKHRIPDQDPQHCEKDRITIPTVWSFLLQLQKLLKIPGQNLKHCFIVPVIQDDGSTLPGMCICRWGRSYSSRSWASVSSHQLMTS
jgi:hypothetical protein